MKSLNFIQNKRVILGMQNKVLDEFIVEVEGSSNASYLLKNPEMFYDIGFRVMKNQDGEMLLDCHKLKYNGATKLVYFTNDLESLSSFLERASADSIGLILNNLVKAVENVEGNGFLNILCIDNRLDRIYVERNTLAIKLIYLPLNILINGSAKGTFEGALRTQLRETLGKMQLLEHSAVQDMYKILENETISLSEAVAKMKEVSFQGKKEFVEKLPVSEEEVCKKADKEKGYTLISINGQINIPINKAEFLIGKSAEKVDGVIAGNPAISRIHCKLMEQSEKLFIKDMNSANGTFVNGKRLSNEEYVAVDEGSRIKLANIEFMIRR